MIIPDEQIERSILVIRSQRVLLDSDLARIYGVSTKRFNEQVHRNRQRFPSDFMFELTEEENRSLNSRNTNLSAGRGGRRNLPKVFTEHGAVMLASVLSSEIAVSASIQVVRAFINLRKLTSMHADLALKLDTLEEKYDRQFKVVFDAVRQIMTPTIPSKKKIGFHSEN